MGIIDTHSHIYLEQFDDDRDEMIRRAFEAGLEKILMPNIDVESIKAMMDLHDKYPENCIPMMGLHPTSVGEGYQKQLDEMFGQLQKHRFCAIGEIGIDLYWDKTYLSQQLEAFRIQLNWAKEFELPVVIHARDAFDEIFQVLDGMDMQGITGVFHSFSGTEEHARKILDYQNFYLGINGVVTFKNSGLDKIVREIGYEKLLLETDAPYLTPTPFRGKRNEPAYINYVVQKLADIFEVSQTEIEDVTTANARDLFNL
ncbi:TatD family hydrolase [Plebeiibacterium marinum]|uniref:TatD family hydrolase n=1 Tax=Plebeiibacterium marinum TaxID=2992111 RepID=A0AAE3MGX5_9BACT|nr:TatD family hydrolase [Plebeiobacterium marinum]MCW3807270.1 TatD family hydrolase [Plebeiobacterium marinum]